MAYAAHGPLHLKTAIVETLERRPNTSCKLDALPGLVLRTLGIDIRGHGRKELVKRLGRSLGDLKRADIVEYYVSKNRRVRLAKEYQERWNPLRVRLARGETQKSSEILDEAVDADLNQQTEIPQAPRYTVAIPRLPPLPEAKYKPERVEDPEGGPAVPPLEDDEERALDALFGVEHIQETDRVRAYESPQHEDIDLMQKLGQALEEEEEYAVDYSPNALQVMFTAGKRVDEVHVICDDRHARLQLSSRAPFRQSAALQILQLASSSDWICIPGLADLDGLWCYLFRASIHIHGKSVSDLVMEVNSFIAELKQAKQVIDSAR